jgi:hypothetical protein
MRMSRWDWLWQAMAGERPPRRKRSERVKQPPLEPFFWRWGNVVVKARTKSEARAALKKELGLGRLPPGAKVEVGKPA